MRALGAGKYSRSISWGDGVKKEPKLGFSFITLYAGCMCKNFLQLLPRFLCRNSVAVSFGLNQVTVPVRWLAKKVDLEMTFNVLSGTSYTTPNRPLFNPFIPTRFSDSGKNGRSGPYWCDPPFLIFWHSGTLALRTERQSARMSEKLKMVG